MTEESNIHTRQRECPPMLSDNNPSDQHQATMSSSQMNDNDHQQEAQSSCAPEKAEVSTSKDTRAALANDEATNYIDDDSTECAHQMIYKNDEPEVMRDDPNQLEDESDEAQKENQEPSVSLLSTSSSVSSSDSPGAGDHQRYVKNNNKALNKSESNMGKSASRLIRATRAIMIFRRAASPVNPSPPSDMASDELATMNDANDVEYIEQRHRGKVHQLAATISLFWRQNTNASGSRQNNNTSSNSTTSGARRKSSKWTHHLTSSKSTNLAQLNDETNLASQQHRQSEPTAACLPRFIVPKMNALKLPIVCLIKSLEGELMREIFVHRYELGQYLIDNLKATLGLKDDKYFGLRLTSSLDDQDNVRQPWLELNESVCKQISRYNSILAKQSTNDLYHRKKTNHSSDNYLFDKQNPNLKTVEFYLRIKYYPPNLARVTDPFLRQYLFMQLRRDLRLGKLTSSINNLTLLMAYILQFEFGDYKPEHVSERLVDLNIIPNQDMIEQQALAIWQKRLAGLKKHQVQMQFLRASVILETYGFDYYPVRDHQRQRGFLLGFNYAGIKTIKNGRIVHHFRWYNLSKISYERRMIIFHVYPNESSKMTKKRKQILGFKCVSNEECQNLYMRLLEQKYFFTVDLAYFDKTVRRPSYLDESPVNGLGEQIGWPEQNVCDDRLRQRQQQQQCDLGFQSSLDTDTGQYYEEDEEQIGEHSPPNHHDRAPYAKNHSFDSAGPQRKKLASDYNNSSLESTNIHIGQPNDGLCQASNSLEFQREQNSCSNTRIYDDCPDCQRATDRQTKFSPAPRVGQSLHRFQAPVPLIKSSSLQDQQHAASLSGGNCSQHLFKYPTHSLSSFGILGSRQQNDHTKRDNSPSLEPQQNPPCETFPQSRSAETMRPGNLTGISVTSLSGRNRGSLQRQKSTWATTPTPTSASPALNSFEAFQVDDNERSPSNTKTTRLVQWIECLLLQPIQASCCWPMIANSNIGQHQENQNHIGANGDQSFSLKYLITQAVRFCLLIVLMNLLVRMSDLVSSSLVELMTFNKSNEPNAQSGCRWVPSQDPTT